MRDLTHPNINPFIGACVEPPNIMILQQYCNKGSLQVRNSIAWHSCGSPKSKRLVRTALEWCLKLSIPRTCFTMTTSNSTGCSRCQWLQISPGWVLLNYNKAIHVGLQSWCHGAISVCLSFFLFFLFFFFFEKNNWFHLTWRQNF